MHPLLYRQVTARAYPQAKTYLEGCHVIDGEGAIGRIVLEGYDILDQLPAFTPPFPKTWVELGKMQVGKVALQHYAGVIVTAADVRSKQDEPDFPPDVKQYLADKGERIGWSLVMIVNVDTLPTSTGEWLGMFTILLTEKGQLVGSVSEDGKTQLGKIELNESLVDLSKMEASTWQGLDITADDIQAGAEGLVQDCAMATLFVMGMLNCKNVALEEVVPSRKVQKKREKHGRLTGERCYIIKVTGKGARAGSMALRVPSGQRNAMHWCRGHFRTYTEDAPLFGRVTGTFWIDSHVRGDRVSGAVTKAYEVDLKQPIPHQLQGAEV